MFAKNQELLILLGQSLLELGILLHEFIELLPQALYPHLRTRDLPDVIVQQQRFDKGLQAERNSIKKTKVINNKGK